MTYDVRPISGERFYLTLIAGRVAEAHRDLWEFVESLESLDDRRAT